MHAAPVATVAEESADRDEIHVAIGGEDTVDIPMSDTDQVVTSNNLNVQARTQVRPDETPMGMLARLTNDAANPAVSSEADYPITPTEEEWLTSTSQKYFTRLHETWPVVHSVTFYSEPSSFASLATVTMIALWLQEPEKLAEPVITLHKALMNRLFDDLVRSVVKYHETLLTLCFRRAVSLLIELISAGQLVHSKAPFSISFSRFISE